jgi:hypothetical protein
MMTLMAECERSVRSTCGNAGRKTEAIRAKFRDVFGRECPLQDDTLLTRYSVTADGDLVMFIR